MGYKGKWEVLKETNKTAETAQGEFHTDTPKLTHLNRNFIVIIKYRVNIFTYLPGNEVKLGITMHASRALTG